MNIRWFAIFSLVFLQSCGGGSSPGVSSTPDEPDDTPTRFSVGADFIYKDGERFDLKGVVYVPGQPGYLPWEIEGMMSLPADVISRIDTDKPPGVSIKSTAHEASRSLAVSMTRWMKSRVAGPMAPSIVPVITKGSAELAVVSSWPVPVA